MIYHAAKITAIRDDLVKSKIVISVEVERDVENLETAEHLAQYSGQFIEVTFAPRQLPMFPTKERE